MDEEANVARPVGDPGPPGGGEHHHHYVGPKPKWGFLDYFWFVLKNLIGWTMIISSPPVGMLIPGPGGLPLFIIGFALITFPGKRRLTARVLRGITVHRESQTYRVTVAAIAILVPGALIIWLSSWLRGQWWFFLLDSGPRSLMLVALYLISISATWVFGIWGINLVNRFLHLFPKGRRYVRPWLRSRGLDLLPPRRRRRLRHPGQHHDPDEEILEIHERHHQSLVAVWTFLKPWLIRLIRVAVVALLFAWILKPVVRQWPEVRPRILSTNLLHFVVAAVMFSAFLFAFRAMAWRRIMVGFGHRLPVAVATRIWSFSELARYLPGVIWQVVGRVYLSRPYGVSGGVSSASQVLELAIFMLANILVALTCLLVAGFRRIPADQRHWIFVAMAFIPVLLLLLHPRIFYSLLNRLMARLGKPPIAQALRKRELTRIVLWTMLGLLWQSLAVWILTCSVLQLPLAKWYVLAGAYCLAWTIGFSVGFLSPGGMGVREAVFITTMQFILPPGRFGDPDQFRAFLGFLGVLLRLWAVTGELLMAGIAYAADYRGARGDPDAPGRIPACAQATADAS